MESASSIFRRSQFGVSVSACFVLPAEQRRARQHAPSKSQGPNLRQSTRLCLQSINSGIFKLAQAARAVRPNCKQSISGIDRIRHGESHRSVVKLFPCLLPSRRVVFLRYIHPGQQRTRGRRREKKKQEHKNHE